MAEESITLNIKELDPEMLKPDCDLNIDKGGGKYVVVGAPGSGKSSLIKSILWEKCDSIPAAIVWSGSEEMTRHYQSWVPDSFIFGELDKKDMSSVTRMMNRQQKARAHLENSWLAIIFDDCMAGPDFLATKEMNHYYKNGRHYANMSIMASQYIMDVKVSIRSCLSGIFILAEPNHNNREKLWKNFGGCVKTLDEFCQLMDALTENHGAMFIDLRSLTNDVSDCIFWYKAKVDQIPADWRFGADAYWKHDEMRRKTD